MITEEMGRQQFDAADRLEAAVMAGRWRGMVMDKLMLVECEQGIMLDAELDRCIRGLRLMGTPDVTPDGLYQLQLLRDEGLRPAERGRVLALADGFEPVDDPVIIAQRLVANDQLCDVCIALFDAMFRSPLRSAKPAPNN